MTASVTDARRLYVALGRAAEFADRAAWLATTTRPLYVALGTVDSEGPPTEDGDRTDVAFRELDGPEYERQRVRFGDVETIDGQALRMNRSPVEFDRAQLARATAYTIVTKRTGGQIVAFGEFPPGDKPIGAGDLALRAEGSEDG